MITRYTFYNPYQKVAKVRFLNDAIKFDVSSKEQITPDEGLSAVQTLKLSYRLGIVSGTFTTDICFSLSTLATCTLKSLFCGVFDTNVLSLTSI
jgi:hypothetical protein